MWDEFEIMAVPPGHLEGACPNHRIVREAGREFVAVEITAGRFYTARLGDRPRRRGARQLPWRLAVYDSAGEFLAGARSGPSPHSPDILCTFIPTFSGTHYIEARGCGFSLGTTEAEATDGVTLRLPSGPQPDDARARAADLGDVTAVEDSSVPIAHVRTHGTPFAFVRFALAQPRVVNLELGGFGTDGELFLVNDNGTALCGRTQAGGAGEWLSAILPPGAYHAGVRMPRRRREPFTLRCKVTDTPGNVFHGLRHETGPPKDRAGGSARGNGVRGPSTPLNGSPARVSLGTVATPDPAGESVRYRLVGGNEAGLFEMHALTGELFFTGTEADLPLGTTEFLLTVRSDDGERSADRTVAISVANVPTPDDGSPRSGERISLGRVALPVASGAALKYRLAGGNERGLFELDEATGELFFNGDAEAFEEAGSNFELAVLVDDKRH